MKIVEKTNFTDLKLLHRGKVRDIYDAGDNLVFIATDRISAYDVVFNEPIPLKGYVLTQLSKFWFEQLSDICKNHLISSEIKDFPDEFKKYKDELKGRSMLVKKVKIIPYECIVRGYITGSAWKEYKISKSICGIKLPDGLVESQKLDYPIFTPTTKEDVGKHDENVSMSQVEDKLGSEIAKKLKDISINLYLRANEIANSRGIIIADTKFEFGIYNDEIILADEVLTPDSSRFWSMEFYEPGKTQDSFDKQIVRNYLDSINFNRKPPAPPLPDEIIEKTSKRYLEIIEILTKKQ